MINFLKITSIIFFTAFIIIGFITIWKYSNFYVNGRFDSINDTKKLINENYNLKAISNNDEPMPTRPDLPDISNYTVEKIKDNLPELKNGSVDIQNLSDGFRKLRRQVDIFGDMQGRLDPVAVVLNDGVYNLDNLTIEVNDLSILEKSEDGVFILHVPLSIRVEGTLIIQPNETLYLDSNTGGILSNFGNLYIVGAKVFGWNVEKQLPSYFVDKEKFRPYITSWCGSKLNIAGSELGYLGYQNSKSYGVSYTSCSDTLYRDDFAHLSGGTGQIIENIFNDMYFGFYSYEAENIVILRNQYISNIVYGIDPHDRSSNLIIAYNEVGNTKFKHGIILSREVNDSFIFNNISHDNKGSGIMLDRNSQGNVIAYNNSKNNVGDGLVFYESPNNISYKNKLFDNNSGLRVRNSFGIKSIEDSINNNEVAVQLYVDDLPNDRDLGVDAYFKKAVLEMLFPEIINNKKSNFKLTEFDYFKIYNPVLFKTPQNNFSGDLKLLHKETLMSLLTDGGFIAVKNTDN